MTRAPWKLAALLLLLSGCTTVVFENTADRLGLLPNEVIDSSYAGETIVWGGRVISLRRAGEGMDLEVMAYPLDTANRPRLEATPGGRFVAHFPGELPDAVFGIVMKSVVPLKVRQLPISPSATEGRAVSGEPPWYPLAVASRMESFSMSLMCHTP